MTGRDRDDGDPGMDDDRELMGAYALGLLDTAEQRAVQTRIAADPAYRREMEELRQMTELLGQVPPEAFLDGPPDGDLVLQRTLRQVRAEHGAAARRRLTRLVMMAAAAVAVVLGGGVLVGRATAPTQTVLAQPPAPPVGGRVLSGGGDGVTMTATITPAAGWVRLAATVRGVPAGERCHLVVVGRDGSRQVAAGWVVSPAGQREGTALNGSAAVVPDQVAAVLVENEAGREFVVLRA